MGTVHFYTIGTQFTSMINDFIEEGSFYQAYEILKDGGMPEVMIKEFFEGKWKFEGDTREGDHSLSVVPDNNIRDEEFWVTAICTMFQFNEEAYNLYRFLHDPTRCIKDSFRKNVESLLKVYTADEVVQKVYRGILRREGWEVFTECPLEKVDGGVILKDGTLVVCGYQEHATLYDYLLGVGVVDSSRWMDDQESLHISSGQISGYAAHILESNFRDEKFPFAQLKMLFDLRSHHFDFYGWRDSTVIERVLKYYSREQDMGAKFGNLKFLETFYPQYKLPKFSKEKLSDDIKQCLRTSPKRSLAGLLNSKFDINENSLNEMLEDWEKYKDVIKDNEFHYFYQEYIEGKNGVSLYESKGCFEYEMSKDRGDIVSGKKGVEILSPDNYDILRKLSSELFKYTQKPIQLEFVVDENDVLYIVQLRLIENFKKEKAVIIATPKEAICLGNSFSIGRVECDADEVLIVDSEADSERLLGKKALIVRENPKFSHILALSSCLRIPSMSGVRIDKLEGRVIIDTNREEGYILKV